MFHRYKSWHNTSCVWGGMLLNLLLSIPLVTVWWCTDSSNPALQRCARIIFVASTYFASNEGYCNTIHVPKNKSEQRIDAEIITGAWACKVHDPKLHETFCNKVCPWLANGVRFTSKLQKTGIFDVGVLGKKLDSSKQNLTVIDGYTGHKRVRFASHGSCRIVWEFCLMLLYTSPII